ncbi:sarcoplasmic calcium-binding protein isoform X1 [Lingula anatina]|uniref:Sarcoplasmic calcium-binding protein isoform X1 n=1 Tax=Lingula anatina TaxID=7574 RepID=A0A1S3ILS3_LINAN|nr:sarcoplasmic calcium-binding protein isoform X1 [Lingula anatina]|eukprot:XP_013399033.1 sarcoplasmic calcium-binding protein isoform X1 [Lingula anatina]
MMLKMAKVAQLCRDYLRITQSFPVLARNIQSLKSEVNGPLLRFVTGFQPVRAFTNKVLRLKKMPIDYPAVTGSEHWRRKSRTIFKCLDSNADGYLTKEDYVSSAKRATEYLNLDDEQAERILNIRLNFWKLLAQDSSDDESFRVSEAGYVQSCISVVNQSTFRLEFYPKLLSMEYDAKDFDGDGLLSQKEFAANFYSLRIPVENAKRAFDSIDSNRDGIISFEEYALGYTEFTFTEEPNNKYNEFFGPLVD